MNKKRVMVLAIGVLLSMNIMGAEQVNDTKSIENDYKILEAEFKKLEAKENERFKEEEKIAKQAEQKLASLKVIKNKSVEREKELLSMVNKSICTEEIKALLGKYEVFINDIDMQQKIEERRVFEFNQLKSLR